MTAAAAADFAAGTAQSKGLVDPIRRSSQTKSRTKLSICDSDSDRARPPTLRERMRTSDAAVLTIMTTTPMATGVRVSLREKKAGATTLTPETNGSPMAKKSRQVEETAVDPLSNRPLSKSVRMIGALRAMRPAAAGKLTTAVSLSEKPRVFLSSPMSRAATCSEKAGRRAEARAMEKSPRVSSSMREA